MSVDAMVLEKLCRWCGNPYARHTPEPGDPVMVALPCSGLQLWFDCDDFSEAPVDPWRYDIPPSEEWVIAWVRYPNGVEGWIPGKLQRWDSRVSERWHFACGGEKPPSGTQILAWMPGPKAPPRRNLPKIGSVG